MIVLLWHKHEPAPTRSAQHLPQALSAETGLCWTPLMGETLQNRLWSCTEPGAGVPVLQGPDDSASQTPCPQSSAVYHHCQGRLGLLHEQEAGDPHG